MASFGTPQKSLDTTRSASSLSKEVGTVREILYLNGLSMDDPTARKTFRQGIDEARDLITEPRHSAPSKQLLDDIDEMRLDYSDRNETTFTNKFFGVFQSKSRQVKQEAQDGHAQVDIDEEIADEADRDQGDFHLPADGRRETGRTMAWTRMITESFRQARSPGSVRRMRITTRS